MQYFNKQVVDSNIDILIQSNVKRGITAQKIRQQLKEITSYIEHTQQPYNVHKYGARGDAIGVLNMSIEDDRISHPKYIFTGEDIDKDVYAYIGWQTPDAGRKIVGVTGDGKAIVSPAYGFTAVRNVIFGTDDTEAIERACDAASKGILTSGYNPVTEGVTSWGSFPLGGMVELESRGYLVKNTLERYNSGLLAAINIPARCGIRGHGLFQTVIYLAPGNHGHALANKGAGVLARDEFVNFTNFSVHMNRSMQNPATCFDGLFFQTGGFGNGYTIVDPYTAVGNTLIIQPPRDSYNLKGHGVSNFDRLFSSNATRYGLWINQIRDSRITSCEIAGSGNTGIKVEAASSTFANCKAYYNGGAAITDYAARYKATASGTWIDVTTAVSTNLYEVLSALPTNTELEVRIASINAIGQGDWSESFVFTTDSYLASHYAPSLRGLFHAEYGITETDGNVTAWADRCGYSSDMTSPVGDTPETGVENINGVNALDFNRSEDDYMVMPPEFLDLFKSSGNYTIIIAFKLNANLDQTQAILKTSADNGLIFFRGDVGTPDIAVQFGGGVVNVAFTPDTNPHILVVKKTGTTLNIYVDGVLTGTGSAATLNLTSASLGRVNASYGEFDGLIPFMSYYNEARSSASINTNCNAVEAELSASWTNIA